MSTPGKRLLVTGFEPFGGQAVNPAWEAVSRLPDAVGDWRIERLQVPTAFGEAGRAVLQKADRVGPDAILCVGQAGGRDAVTPEMAALNLRHASIADNAGAMPKDEPVCIGGPTAYFSTLPAQAMAEAVADAGIKARVSYSAGVFVCNDLFYSLLHQLAGTPVRVGFIHVPYLPEQAKGGEPSLPLEETVRALEAAIGAI